MSYYRDVYLKSDSWRKLKKLKESKSIKRCIVCHTTQNIDLHHLVYKPNLNDIKPSELRWLCRRCHEKAHELIASGEIVMDRSKGRRHLGSTTQYRVRKALGIPMYKEKSNLMPIADSKYDMEATVESLKTAKGGWTRRSLESLGVPWPPPKGWKRKLIATRKY